MRELSPELRERLSDQRDDKASPLPVSQFVRVEWPLDGDGEETVRRCYSTLTFEAMMDGNRYRAEDLLLDFNNVAGAGGFVMNQDHLIYGASCGFRIVDSEGLAGKVIAKAHQNLVFPAIYCEVWWHFSEALEEIESLRYGLMMFGSFVTRIELQEDKSGRSVAMVWGGYEGIARSKTREDTSRAASVVNYRVPIRAFARMSVAG